MKMFTTNTTALANIRHNKNKPPFRKTLTIDRRLGYWP